MTARGEALPPRLLCAGRLAGWTHASNFFSAKIPPPEALEVWLQVNAAHDFCPEKPRAINSFMISLVPP